MDNDKKNLLFSNHFNNQQTSYDINLIGQKALGLSKLDTQIVPPYFIITSHLFKLWLSNKIEEAKSLLIIALQEGIKILEENEKLLFIVRSSAKYESFDERGFYESSTGNLRAGELFNAVLQVWKANLKSIQKPLKDSCG